MPSPMDALINPGIKSGYTANGPIAGIIASQQLQDWQDAQQRAFRDSDQASQARQIELQNAMADQQNKQTQSAIGAAQGQDTLDAWKDPTQMPAIAKAQREEQLQKTIAGKSLEELKQADSKMTAIFNASSKMGDKPTPAAAAEWPGVYEELKKMGADKGFTADYSPAYHDRLNSLRAAAINTQPVVQKSILAQQEYTSKEKIAKMEVAGRENVAQIMANAQDPVRATMNKIRNKVQETGTISEDDMTKYVGAIRAELLKPGLPADIAKQTDQYATILRGQAGDSKAQKETITKTLQLPEGTDPLAAPYIWASKQLDERAKKQANDDLGSPKVVGSSGSTPAPKSSDPTNFEVPKGKQTDNGPTVIVEGVSYKNPKPGEYVFKGMEKGQARFGPASK